MRCFILICILFCTYFVQAESYTSSMNDTLFDKEKLRVLEGYYKFQFEKGVDSYIYISIGEGVFLLRQMWDGEELVFTLKSDSEFIGRYGRFPLKFRKDKNGHIATLWANNKDLWHKTGKYIPPVIREVRLDSGQLARYQGIYTWHDKVDNDDDSIRIYMKGRGLILERGWDKDRSFFVPLSKLDFVNEGGFFHLKFVADGHGTISKAIAFKGAIWRKVKS